MTKIEIATLVIASGLAAGLVNALVTLLSGAWERGHRSEERQAVEEHEALLRREASHDAAIATFLPKAQELATWADKVAYDSQFEAGGDFLYVGTQRAILSEEAAVLDLLRDIMWGHPTKSVRDKARAIFDAINNAWSEIVGNQIPEPTTEQLIDWSSDIEGLVELIHTREPATN